MYFIHKYIFSKFSGNTENGINHKIQPLTNGNHHTEEIEPEELVVQETKNGGTELFKVKIIQFQKNSNHYFDEKKL